MPDAITAVEQNLGGNDPQTPAAKPARKGPPLTPMSGIKFRAIDFRDTGGSTGVRMDPRRQEKGRVVETGKVEMSQPLVDQYRKFLGEYVSRLIDARVKHPNILDGERHAHDRDLLTILAPNNEVDPGKIDQNIAQFMQRPEGWAIATEVLEQQTTLQLFALGLRAEMSPAYRDSMLRTLSYRLGIERGILDRLWSSHIAPFLGEIQGTTAGRDIGASGVPRYGVGIDIAALSASLGVGGAMVFGLPGAIVGAALPPAAAGIIDLFGRGLHVDTRQTVAAFQAISAHPEEREYLWAVAGIDVEDYQIQGGRVELRQNRTPQTTRPLTEIQAELIGNLCSRFQFLKEIGVPEKTIDFQPEFFLDPRLDRMEQTGVRYEKILTEKFRALGGVQANHQRTTIERFMKARRETITELIEDYIKATEVKQDPKATWSTSIAEQITARETDTGRIRKEREKAIRSRIEGYEQDRTTLSGEKGTLDTYNQALTELQNARNQLTKELQTRIAGAPNYDQAIAALQAVLTEPNTNITIDNANIASTFQAYNDLDDWESNKLLQIRAAFPPGPNQDPDDYNKIITPKDAKVTREKEVRKAKIDANVAKINELITRLQSLKETIDTQSKRLRNSEQVVINASKITIDLVRDYDHFAAGGNLAAIGITPVDLATQTIDQLLQRINQFNHANPNVGWKEEDNLLPENRSVVLHAMVDARARNIAGVGNPTPDFMAFTGATWQLTENDLLTLTDDQILARLQLRQQQLQQQGLVPPALPAQNTINNVIKEAKNRFDARFNMYTQTLEQIPKDIEAARKALTLIDLKSEISKYKLAQELLGKWSEMSSRALRIRRDIGRYIDRNQIDPNNPALTAAEKGRYDVNGNLLPAGAPGSTLPAGYLEITNVLFGYQNEPDAAKREEGFKQIVSFLPPEKLAEALRQALGIPVQLAPGPMIDLILEQIRVDYANGTIRAFDIQQGLTNMINTLAARAAVGNMI